MSKKIFMAGCGGMLGEAFYNVFKNDYNVLATDKIKTDEWIDILDFRDKKAYRDAVLAFKPDYLFHLGAYTDLEFCEKNVADTYLTNTIAVDYAITLANELGIPLLYISTAGIFDGGKDLYDDWDMPNPLGVYARSKFIAERNVVEYAKRHLICRAGWMMGGGSSKDKKFIYKLIKQINSGVKELFIVNDKDGTPTYTYDFANNVKFLIENNLYGLFNLVCGGQTGRLEVAKELLRILGLDSVVSITEVESDYFADIYFAQRPPNERLINYKLDLLNANFMRDWKVALSEYIDSEFSDIKNKLI
jgi:dTDP-4-dehydrorhamnose reductase